MFKSKVKFAAGLAALGAISCAIAQTEIQTKPDALLQIDMNRPAVVERIVSSWGKEIPAAQIADLKQKLMGLRADQLLAANVSGSFDGVLEIMERAQSSASVVAQRVSNEGVRAKAVGEATRDLVYTPVTPCRIIDTRGAGPGILVGGTKRDIDVITSSFAAQGGSATSCDIDAGAVAIAVNLTSTAAPSGGNLRAYSSSLATAPTSSNVNYPGTAIQVSEANFAIVPICTASCPGGLEMSVLASSNTHLVADVAGYFMPPKRNGEGLRVFALTGTATASTRPNVVNGDDTNQAISTSNTMRGATISGGYNNFIGNDDGGYGWYGTIGGGSENRVGLVGGLTGDYGTVAGGSRNTASGDYSVIGGGNQNTASGFQSSVLGGSNNVASGQYSAVLGGLSNSVSGTQSLAAGRGVLATGNGCAIFAFWSNASRTSDCGGLASYNIRLNSDNGTIVNFLDTGGADQYIYFGNSFGASVHLLSSSGATLTSGGVWTNNSDRARKENLTAVNPVTVLNKLVALPITKWNYKDEGAGIKRMGAMAQDFYQAFGLGNSEKNIGSVDADGVAFAAIQGLNQKLEAQAKAKDAQIKKLESELALIKKKLGL